MDKRSFIRGFGVGVLFTALILGISFVVRTSDAYVKSQALKLGMVYQDEPGEDLVFASPGPGDSGKQKESDNNEDNSGGDKKAKVTQKPKKPAAPKETAKPKSTAAPKATQKAGKSPEASGSPLVTKKPAVAFEPTAKPGNARPKGTPAPKGKQTLTIVAGEWSSDVSAKLERMGIVKSAKQFDKYLNDNGYSEKINAGTYSVSADDTFEQLARRITKK